MRKADLRKKYLERRLQLTPAQVQGFSEAVTAQFFSAFKPRKSQIIHIFLPMNKFNELNTRLIIDECWSKGMCIFVPRINGNQLESVEFCRDSEIVQHPWGLSEPTGLSSGVQFDFVLVPMLYCDPKGQRIGYGKGFYDRFFSSLNYKVPKIGLNMFSPDEIIDDAVATDVAMDYLVTPYEVLSFGTLTSKSLK